MGDALIGAARDALIGAAGDGDAPLPAGRRAAVTAEGRRVAYHAAGAGPDAVLIHGTLMTADDMRLGPVPALAGAFRCISFDRPGHGWSDRRPGDGSPWSQAATLRAAAVALGLRRPVLCGHSYGGAVALAYAMLFPDEIAGAVALAPICFPEPRIEQALFGPRAGPLGPALSRGLAAALDPFLLPGLWRSMFLPDAMPARFASGFPFARAGRPEQMEAEGEDAAGLWAGLGRSALGYAGCRAPVRILCGGADLVVNPALHGALAGLCIPGASFDVLPGVGHMLHHARPGAVLDAMRAVVRLP